MNQEKIGLFIKKLREENSLTQEELAKKVFHGRDAISKWERGKNLPDTETLLILSDIFHVSVNEILAGERNTSQNITLDLYNERNKINKKVKRIILVFILIILISISSFLAYYFVNQYKTIHAYTINGQTDAFNITNGLFIRTNNKLYFSIGNITSNKNEEIEKIELYYSKDNKENLICRRYSEEMLLTDYKGYEEYFDLKIIDYILNNLYLKIYYDNKSETVKLTVTEDYINDNLVFKNDLGVYTPGNTNKLQQDDIINTIKSKFGKEEENYVYNVNEKGYEKNFMYAPMTNSLTITFLKNNEKIEEWIYDIGTKVINYNNYKLNELYYSLTFYNEEYNCTYGECLETENKINEFKSMLEELLE